MSELKIIQGGLSPENAESTGRRETAERVIDRCQTRLMAAGIDLFDEDQREAVRNLLMAKLSNPALSSDEAARIHPKADEILAITSDRGPEPGPAAPGAAMQEMLRNQAPDNDNDIRNNGVSFDKAA